MSDNSLTEREFLGPIKKFRVVFTDLNGLIQLFFDNASTTLILTGILLDFWGNQAANFLDNQEERGIIVNFANEMVWSRVVPGAALGMFFGNVAWTWLSLRLSYQKNENVTTMPLGINTPAAFGFLFSIIVPELFNQLNSNCTDGKGTVECVEDAITASWAAGVVSNFLSGIIMLCFSFFGKIIGKSVPMAILMASLATICIAFLVLNNVVGNFAYPISGYMPFIIMIAMYFGRVEWHPLPTALVVACVGIILGWSEQAVTSPDILDDAVGFVKWYGVVGGASALGDWSIVSTTFGIVLSLAIQTSAGTIMNVSSARICGDDFDERVGMSFDGFSSMMAALCGSPFNMSSYVGYPAYHQAKAGNGYAILNASLYLLCALFGLFALLTAIIPQIAISPIISFVGILLIGEAVKVTPQRKTPLFVVALLPGLADWATSNGVSFDTFGNTAFGVIALGRANILCAMMLAGIIYYLIDRNYLAATGWSVVAGVFSAIGLLHQSQISFDDYETPYGAYCISKESLGITNVTAACPGPDFVACEDTALCGFKWTTRWRFLTAYFVSAASFLIMYGAQRIGWIDAVEPDEDSDEFASDLAAKKSAAGFDADHSEEYSTNLHGAEGSAHPTGGAVDHHDEDPSAIPAKTNADATVPETGSDQIDVDVEASDNTGAAGEKIQVQ